MNSRPFLTSLMRCFALLLVLNAQVFAQQSTAVSNLFTLDTRVGVLIRGVVLDGNSPTGPYAPLAGASVTVGANSTTTNAAGAFEIKAPLTSAQTATISHESFATWTKSLGPQASGTDLDLGAIILRLSDKPVVQSVELAPDYCFLADRGLQTQLNASINWLTFTPGRVELREGTRLLASNTAAGPTTTFPLNIDALFPGGSPRAYNLVVTAIGAGPSGEIISLPLEQPLHVFPLPAFLQPLKSQAVTSGQGIALDFSLSTKEQKVILPVIGRFGYDFSLGGSFDYGLGDGSWETALGGSATGSQGKRGRRPKVPGFTSYARPRLYIGNRELELEMFARAAGEGQPGYGIQVQEMAGGMSLSARQELMRYGLLDLIGPGLTTAARNMAGEEFVRKFSARLDALPEVSGQVVFAPRWPLDFKEATVGLGLGLESVYHSKVSGRSAKFYLGGKATGTFGLPEPIFRQVNFKGYAGINVDAWVFKYDAQYVFLDYTFPGRRLPEGSYPIRGGLLLAAKDNAADWSLNERDWRNAGTEQFLPPAAGPARRLDGEQSDNDAALEQFSRMAAAPSPGAVYQPPANRRGRRLISDSTLPAGADLPLLANVYPGSTPSLAARGSDLMLLYVRDTGAANPAQFTEIAWTRFDGTKWSVPSGLGAAPSTTYSEGFNSATVPAGWAVDKTGDLDVSFVQASSNPTGFSPSEGSRMVRVNNYDVDFGTVRLRKTDPLSTVNRVSGTVTFDWTVDDDYEEERDSVSVEWSANGTTWTSMGWVYRYSSTGSAWTQRSFNLPAAALGLPQVFISLRFRTGYGNDCHLDNLRISLSSPAQVERPAHFRPQVAYAANGDAIAVFERVKDASYSGSDITAYAGLMEICWSQWNSAAQTWSTPEAFTNNAILDFEPRLAGPMADGSLVACWRESAAGKLDASPAAPQRLMSARWSPGTGTWSAPFALLAADEGLLASDLSAAADKAVVTWCVDGDGDSATPNDSEIFYRVFTAGAWGAPMTLSADAVPDGNPQVWVDATGNTSLVWNKNGALVFSRNFAVPAAIRDTAEGLIVAEYSLTGGPGGNLVLIWQDMGPSGSDTFYRVYDPASSLWSRDTRMSADSDVEQDYSPVWDAVGNLTIAYNNSPVTFGTVSVATQGAGTVQVENVPQAGPMSLLLAKRAIVRDLAIVPGSLTATGLGFTPGQVVSVTCEVINSGNVAVSAPVVAFYIGDPAEGGVEINRQTIAGWLVGSESRQVTFSWTIPAPAQTRLLHVVIDPDKSVTEFSETNNGAAISVGGSDLEVAARVVTVLRDGALRLVAKVSNIGSAPAAVSGLKLLRDGPTPVMLQEKTVPQIEAGSSAELVFELPPGTQPEGEGYYRLTVDGEALSGDPDPLNNSAAFIAVHWIDDDRDGLPRWWEVANGLSDANPLDGTGDRDGDGFSEAAEFLAGTNPRNGADFLRVGSFHATSVAPDGATRQVSFSWATVAGAVYDIQRSFSLSGGWETIATDVTATPPLNSYVDSLSQDHPRAFYRLRAK